MNPPRARDYANTLFEEIASPMRSASERWARVEQLCTDQEPESLHLDFKGVHPAADPGKETYIREKLARALSGFANVAGGLLIYGVSTVGAPKGEPDRAQRVVPIASVGRFRAALEKLASQVVEPVIEGVDIREVEDPSNSGSGVVLVHIPESVGGPHRATSVGAGTSEHYFMRTTTEIVVMPHTTLADRFSRVAGPMLRIVTTLAGGGINFGLNVRLRNIGRGVSVQPAILFSGVDNQLAWYSNSGLAEHWRMLSSRGAPTPGRVVYQAEPNVVVYPGLDLVVANVGHGQGNSGASAKLMLEGEIYCREAPSVPFRGIVHHGIETILPS